MKTKCVFLGLFALALLLGTGYGFLLKKHELFPYKQLHQIKNRIAPKDHSIPNGPWSISIYQGDHPLRISGPEDINNPVLTREDVTDADVTFVADPFMTKKNDKWFMFFEIYQKNPPIGKIAYAESDDGKNWNYKKIILEEPFHLSYPHIFNWEGVDYMIPESGEDLSVRLYKSTAFPENWEYVDTLMSGYDYIDPTIFRHQNKWWLFTANSRGTILNLHYADELRGEWKPHPANPIIRFDNNIARPAGSIIKHEGKLYRLAQDSSPIYGYQVFAFEITELTDTVYTEKLFSEDAIVGPSGEGWNAAGMHHIDSHFINGMWTSVVDGRDR